MHSYRVALTRPKTAAILRTGLSCLLLAATLRIARAQETPSPETALDLAAVEAQKAAIAQQPGLDETLRGQIAALYDDAIKQLNLAEEWRNKAADWDKQREEAPARVKEIQDTLALPPEEFPPIADGSTLADLEPLLAEAEGRYRETQSEYDQLMAEPRRRADRRREIPALIAAAKDRLHAFQAQESQPAPQGAAPEAAAARQAAALAGAQAAMQEITALEKELQAIDASTALLTLKQELARRRLAQAEKRAKALREAAGARRRDEAEIAAEEARRALEEVSELDPEIQNRAVKIAVQTAHQAEHRAGVDGLAEKIESGVVALEALRKQRTELAQAYDAVSQRVRTGGLNQAVSLQLRDLKQRLPGARELRERNRTVGEAISATENGYSELVAQQSALAELDNDAKEAIAELRDERTEHEINRLTDSFNDFVYDQRVLLDALTRDYQTYLNILFETNTELTQFMAQVNTITDYINERIFWTRGTTAFRMSLFREALDAAQVLADPELWARAALLVEDELVANPAWYAAAAMPLLVYLAGRRRLRQRLRFLGRQAINKKETHFGQTVQATILTLLIAAAWPVVLAVVGWRVTVVADPVDTVRAAGGGLLALALLMTLLALCRHVLDRDGLAEAHFGFPARYAKSIRRLIVLLTFVELPFVFIVFACEYQTSEEWKESLGRLAFVVGSLLFAIAAAILLTLLHRASIEAKRGGWLEERPHLRRLMFLIMPGAPALLAALALGGYYYTALQLATRLFQTYALVLAVLLVMALTRRWLLLARRRLAIEQARRRREAAKTDEEESVELAEEEVDIVRIDAQSQTVVRVAAGFVVFFGVWAIWMDVIPALGFFDQFPLWTTTTSVQETYTDANGQAATRAREEIVNITVSDAGLAVIIAVITFIAVRNLPGLLEMVLLKRLGPGERYALLAVVRYALSGLGIVLAFNAVGIGWSKVQWLVAALGLGLGFGLQEIFANFISGLIILFERPIRVGDTVTLGGVSGTVTRIRIRATTIMDWDRKELIVPNKEFVTGQLINWSLTDTVTRVVIPVGVAYGSDTRKTIEVLLRVARAHPAVLADPEPQALFLGFGESTLNFELRVFCAELSERLGLFHDLHMAVDKAFREAGIEIAFPQRDLHIRSGLDRLIGPSRSEPAAFPKIDEHGCGDAPHAAQD